MNRFSGTVLVARDGAPILVKGYGMADAEWQVPNTAQTKFRLGSITKQFTATVVLRLQEQKKLSVQDPICTYLDAVPGHVEAGHHPAPADAHLRHPQLHGPARLREDDDGAEDDRAGGRRVP